jgi:hypothetical protein
MHLFPISNPSVLKLDSYFPVGVTHRIVFFVRCKRLNSKAMVAAKSRWFSASLIVFWLLGLVIGAPLCMYHAHLTFILYPQLKSLTDRLLQNKRALLAFRGRLYYRISKQCYARSNYYCTRSYKCWKGTYSLHLKKLSSSSRLYLYLSSN